MPLARVLPELENQTIAAALRRWLPGKSCGEIRQLLRARHVQINGNMCVDAGRRLKLTDVIKVLEQPAAAPPKAADVRVVFLDQHVAVVEKPSGLTSNRHREERSSLLRVQMDRRRRAGSRSAGSRATSKSSGLNMSI